MKKIAHVIHITLPVIGNIFLLFTVALMIAKFIYDIISDPKMFVIIFFVGLSIWGLFRLHKWSGQYISSNK